MMLLDGCASGRGGVLDAVLALLELDRRRSDADHTHATGEHAALLELLAVPVGVGVLDLGSNLAHAVLDGLLVATTLDDRGVVLGDDDAAAVPSTSRPTWSSRADPAATTCRR